MSKNSAIILVFGWFLIILAVLGLGFGFNLKAPISNNQESYLAGECRNKKSYYQLSDLTKEEQKQFSSNAVGLQTYNDRAEQFRIVLDYNLIHGQRDKIKIKFFIRSGSTLGQLSIASLINGVQAANEQADPEKDYLLFNTPEIELSAANNSIGLIILNNKDCEFKVSSLINLNNESPSLGGQELDKFNSIAKTYLINKTTLEPGINYLGFDEWKSFQGYRDAGLKIASFDSSLKKFISADQIAEPGRGFAINNPTNQKITLDRPDNFRVPDDVNAPVLSLGWNLLYQSDNEKIADLKVYINNDRANFISNKYFTLGELVKEGYGSADIYVASQSLQKQNLNLANLDSQGVFWFYLKKEPTVLQQQLNLSLKILGADDTFSKGAWVPIKLSVQNNSDTDHYLISPQSGDACQIYLEIIDEQGKKLYSSADRSACPLWPKLEKLSPGAKKEYNYTWKLPDKFSGQLTAKAYLTYDRQAGSQISDKANLLIK